MTDIPVDSFRVALMKTFGIKSERVNSWIKSYLEAGIITVKKTNDETFINFKE